MFNFFKKTAKKTTKKVVKMYKYINVNDLTEEIIVDQSGLRAFLMNDLDDNYKLVETWEE